MNELQEPKHWLIRVKDGINFKNSKYPFWGVKSGKNNSIKGTVKKIKEGDILWFFTSKKYGGRIIGMGEFTTFYDRRDEPLIKIHTFSNKEQGWIGDDNWAIQIHYKNLYLLTERQNIPICIRCSAIILRYETFENRIKDNLKDHYKFIKFYTKPVIQES